MNFTTPIAQLNMDYDPATLVVIGFVIIQAVRWFWEMRQNQREADERVEPRHDPPIHKEYVARDEFNRHVKACPAVKNDFATRAEMRQVHNEVDQLRDDMQKEFGKLRHDSAESRNKMYGGIRSLEQIVSRLEKSDALQTDTLGEIRSDIKSLINQVGIIKGKTEKS